MTRKEHVHGKPEKLDVQTRVLLRTDHDVWLFLTRRRRFLPKTMPDLLGNLKDVSGVVVGVGNAHKLTKTQVRKRQEIQHDE